MSRVMKLLLVMGLVLIVSSSARSKTIHVKESGTGDGSSWTNAYGLLQDALDDAVTGDEIWIAAGTYYPTTEVGGTGDRYKTFQMINGVKIYGGFAVMGNPTWDDRDYDTYESILSGDIGTTGDNSDNCYHVFYHPYGTGLDATAILDGCTITAGNADGSSGDYDQGGGMYNDVSDLTVSNCTFTDNSANMGGGMFNSGSVLTIANCTFSNNSAADRGGGIRNLYGSPTVSNCTFTGNMAIDYGGGIYSACFSTPTVDRCTFTDNEANYGGGIYNNDIDATVINCTFTDNEAGEAGGMYNYGGNSLVTYCSFTGNVAFRGGGMFNYLSDPTVTNCTFSSNEAIEDPDSSTGYGGVGGGMWNWDGTQTIIDCIFNENTADEEGGGMYNSKTNSSIVTNCSFIGNSAHDGGGMYNYRSDPTVTNCIFSSNTAEVFGAGMYNVQYSDANIINCSFSTNASNWAGGGMVNFYYGNNTVTNCIFWGNTAVSSGSQMSIMTGTTTTISYCDIEGCGGSGAGWASGLGTDGGGNIDADPLFIDADGIGEDNLRLQSGSPCIDAGDNSAISETTDLDGNPRKVDDPATTDTGSGSAPFVDMGAYEFLQAIAGLMRGESATLIPNGQSGPPTKNTQVFFKNISGLPLIIYEVRVRQYNTDLHDSSHAYRFVGITVPVETSLADGKFFATIKIPFNKADLGGSYWKVFDLRYWNGNIWILAVRDNTKNSPGYSGPIGDRFVDEGTTIPSLSSDLGDYGVYWNPVTEEGFIWANVDHTTDFAAVWLLGDFEPDYHVDICDLSTFVNWWNTSCGKPDYCEGVDLDRNGSVDLGDFTRFAQNWLRFPGN